MSYLSNRYQSESREPISDFLSGFPLSQSSNEYLESNELDDETFGTGAVEELNNSKIDTLNYEYINKIIIALHSQPRTRINPELELVKNQYDADYGSIINVPSTPEEKENRFNMLIETAKKQNNYFNRGGKRSHSKKHKRSNTHKRSHTHKRKRTHSKKHKRSKHKRSKHKRSNSKRSHSKKHKRSHSKRSNRKRSHSKKHKRSNNKRSNNKRSNSNTQIREK